MALMPVRRDVMAPTLVTSNAREFDRAARLKWDGWALLAAETGAVGRDGPRLAG
jgi:hypothetical protein